MLTVISGMPAAIKILNLSVHVNFIVISFLISSVTGATRATQSNGQANYANVDNTSSLYLSTIASTANQAFTSSPHPFDENLRKRPPTVAPRPVFRLHYSIYYNVSFPFPVPVTSSARGGADDDSSDHDDKMVKSTTVPLPPSARLPTTSIPVPDVNFKVSNECAKFYARTFLENLIAVEPWFKDQCAGRRGSDGEFNSVNVVVHPVVVVTVYGSMVKIDTDLSVTSVYFEKYDQSLAAAAAADVRPPYNVSLATAANDVEDCAAKINVTFHSGIERFDSMLNQLKSPDRSDRRDYSSDVDDSYDDNGSGMTRPHQETKQQRRQQQPGGGGGSKWRSNSGSDSVTAAVRRFTAISNDTGRCTVAKLTMPGFAFRSAGWDCTGDLVLDRRQWICKTLEAHVAPPTTTPHTTTTKAKQTIPTSTLTTAHSAVNSTDVTKHVSLPTVTESAIASTTKPPKPWGAETLRNITRIYVTEGDRPFDLGLRIWYNYTALCGSDYIDGRQSDVDCSLTVSFAFADSNSSSEPVCHRANKPIPQLVLGHPSSTFAQPVAGGSFCSLRLQQLPPYEAEAALPNATAEVAQQQQTVEQMGSTTTSLPAASPATSASGALRVVTGSVFVKAVIDHKYDRTQTRIMTVSMTRHRRRQLDLRQLVPPPRDQFEDVALTETLLRIPVIVEDRDRKSTCQSVNDPHVTTFDGLEYNNFLEGEFVLYRHQTLPFSVHVVYQKCQRDVAATCNCAVAVRSGDDVIVIDRCFRKRHPLPPPVGGYSDDHPPVMTVRLYLNGQLTPGTSIHQDADGRKYFIYLPHGAYVKVSISGQLINVWIVPSSSDLYLTKGLCGIYDGRKANDVHWKNGSTIAGTQKTYDRSSSGGSNDRIHPTDFILDWRVEMLSKDSLLEGVESSERSYENPTYCRCEDHEEAVCGVALDTDLCDLKQGRDITEVLVSEAQKSLKSPRSKRDTSDNSVEMDFDSVRNIDVTPTNRVPSKFKWKNQWNEASAKQFCRKYIKDDYNIGKLCAQIKAVNFQQEITTCVEDIQITGNTSWADSARDAMKEQCKEEARKNTSLPRHLVDRVNNELCINDCSRNGICINGSCQCHSNYSTADCSVYVGNADGETHSMPAPETSAAWRYGLCDIRTMNCSHVMVYGNNFIDSANLTCHYQEVQVTETKYIARDVYSSRRAQFINFNAVECAVPLIRSYLISISNNGVNKSQPLLFIPFDSVCTMCHVFNTTCVKIRNNCIIDGVCYREGESSPNDRCLVCRAYFDEYQWTTATTGDQCRKVPTWWDVVHLPDWVVAVAAAIGGSLIGVVIGFLLYKCCCRRKKPDVGEIDDDYYYNSDENDTSSTSPTVRRDRNSLSHYNDGGNRSLTGPSYDDAILWSRRHGQAGNYQQSPPVSPSSSPFADDDNESMIHRNHYRYIGWQSAHGARTTGSGGVLVDVGPLLPSTVDGSLSDLIDVDLPTPLRTTPPLLTLSSSSSSTRESGLTTNVSVGGRFVPSSSSIERCTRTSFSGSAVISDGRSAGEIQFDNGIDSTTYF